MVRAGGTENVDRSRQRFDHAAKRRSVWLRPDPMVGPDFTSIPTLKAGLLTAFLGAAFRRR